MMQSQSQKSMAGIGNQSVMNLSVSITDSDTSMNSLKTFERNHPKSTKNNYSLYQPQISSPVSSGGSASFR